MWGTGKEEAICLNTPHASLFKVTVAIDILPDESDENCLTIFISVP